MFARSAHFFLSPWGCKETVFLYSPSYRKVKKYRGKAPRELNEVLSGLFLVQLFFAFKSFVYLVYGKHGEKRKCSSEYYGNKNIGGVVYI